MFKNRMARKLFLYFAETLVLFSVLLGIVFLFLFKDYIIKINKSNMLKKATSISETVNDYLTEENGLMGFGSFLRSIEYTVDGDVWVIGKNRSILTSRQHGKGYGRTYAYQDLPVNAEKIVKQVFGDNTVFSEEFSDVLKQTTLTLGVPIKNISGEVIGAVLLHSPVENTNIAVYQGILLLVISITFALVLSFILSIWMSKRFTDPIVLKEAEDALRLEKVRRDLVANVSHELKTPITVIRGSAEALRDGVVESKNKQQEYYNQIIKESKYLQSMVADLLDLSKLQNTDFPIEKKDLLILETIEDAVRSLRGVAKAKGIEICLNLQEKEKIIMGDYERIRQMIIILLDNAIKFSGDAKKVEISLENNILKIKDYGIGIPPNELPYIFDRFHKSRNEQNKEGTGLGLSIAKQIAERHNMGLCVKSEIGKGTVFSISL